MLARLLCSVVIALGVAAGLALVVPEWSFWTTFAVWLVPFLSMDLLVFWGRRPSKKHGATS